MARAIGHQFVVCLRNDDYPVSLEKRNLYEAVPDADAKKYRQIRIIDDSGEDYPRRMEYFLAVPPPKAAERVLASAEP